MPIRVLHVASSLDSRCGGPQSALVGLAAAQQAAGAEVSVISTWRSGDQFELERPLALAGVKVELVGPAKGPLRGCRGLGSAIERRILASDIVHIHGLWEEIQHQAARSAARAGVPYVISPHGMLDPWSLAQKRFKKSLYISWRLGRNLRAAAALHFTSRQERRLSAPLTLGSEAFVEPFGVDLDAFRETLSGDLFRERFPAIAGRRIVLFLGRIHPIKGVDLLIQAMASFHGAPIVLVLAGPGEEDDLAALHRLVGEHDLESQVVFTGMLGGDLRVSALAAAEILALPSQHENFGMVVIEALAMGCPVVLSDQVHIQEEIVQAGVGSSTPRDVPALAGEIRRWLTDDALRREASRRARPFVQDRFAWPAIAARFLEHYARLQNSTQPPRRKPESTVPMIVDGARPACEKSES